MEGIGIIGSNQKKLCYILPKYDANGADHFYHTYEFLDYLGENLDIILIIEKCIGGKPDFKNLKEVYAQRYSSYVLLRTLELLFLLIKVRMKGYKKFYVHYSFYGGILASLFCDITKGEVYYWECNTCKNTKPLLKDLKNIKIKIKNELPRYLTMKVIDYLVTGTEGVGEWYRHSFNLPKERILIIPNDINLKRFERMSYDREKIKNKYGVPAGNKVILFVHYLGERKGAQYIPEIAKELLQDTENVSLLVAGEGPKKEYIVAKIKRDCLDGNVFFLGNIPNREIAELFAIADVFIMPSDEEGFPRVLLEAMIMKVPFVAAGVGGVKEICAPEQLEFIVERGNISLFVKKVKILLQENRTRYELKKAGFEHVKKYSTERVKEIFISTIFQSD